MRRCRTRNVTLRNPPDTETRSHDRHPSAAETPREALADRYQLQREIGRGGTAWVHIATDLEHRREVAAKVHRLRAQLQRHIEGGSR